MPQLSLCSFVPLCSGPFTAQKRTGCWLAEWTNSSARAAMKPCSPANDSFNQRRSMTLSWNESGGGLKANQFVSSAATAAAAVQTKPESRTARVDPGIREYCHRRTEIPPRISQRGRAAAKVGVTTDFTDFTDKTFFYL